MNILYVPYYRFGTYQSELSQFGYGKGTKYGVCSEHTIIPEKCAYLLKTDTDDAQASILELELSLYTTVKW